VQGVISSCPVEVTFVEHSYKRLS